MFQVRALIWIGVCGVLCFIAEFSRAEIPQECLALMNTKDDECCDFPDDDDDDSEEALVKECYEKVTAKKFPEEHKEADVQDFNITLIECIDECHFSKSGLLLANNELNKDKVKEYYLGDHKGDTIWMPVAESAIKSCLEEGSKRMRPESTCKSGSYQVNICFMTYLYKNCPKEKWTKSDACEAEKSLIDKCVQYYL